MDGSPLHASPAPAAEGRQQEDEGRGRRLSTTTAAREDFSSRTPGPLYNRVAGGEVAGDAARLILAARIESRGKRKKRERERERERRDEGKPSPRVGSSRVPSDLRNPGSAPRSTAEQRRDGQKGQGLFRHGQSGRLHVRYDSGSLLPGWSERVVSNHGFGSGQRSQSLISFLLQLFGC